VSIGRLGARNPDGPGPSSYGVLPVFQISKEESDIFDLGGDTLAIGDFRLLQLSLTYSYRNQSDHLEITLAAKIFSIAGKLKAKAENRVSDYECAQRRRAVCQALEERREARNRDLLSKAHAVLSSSIAEELADVINNLFARLSKD
jgi:hypothetical protein